MTNPKLNHTKVDGIIYGYVWFDFGDFNRIDIYKNDKRIGQRKLPIKVDQGETTIKYLVRRMVGKYGIPAKFAAP